MLFRLLLVVLTFTGCSLDSSAISGGHGEPDATGADASPADAPAVDAPAGDSSTPPRDSSVLDGAPPDTGPSDTGPSDSSVSPDAAPGCTTHTIDACSTSHPDIMSCERLYDGLELVPACPTLSRVSLDCRAGTASYCDTSTSCPDGDGCVENVWIRFDLGAAVPVSQVRFMAGWWADRPDLFEIWYSDSPSDVPDSGATLAYGGSSAHHPWACAMGEPCTAEVPDGCCPDGRDMPQVTEQSSYTPSCDLGDHFPKLDIADFPTAVGRYWYMMVRNGAYADRIWLYEFQLRDGAMCR